MSLVDQQLAKISPTSGANQLLRQLAAEQQSAPGPAAGGGGLDAAIGHRNEQAQADAMALAQQQIEQARIENETALTTAPTQIVRGLADAVMAPAALLGAEHEFLGKVTGIPQWQKFGRDLGQSASGESALEAAAYLFGGGGQHGLTTSERVQNHIAEQQKAWPTLSTVSHLGGEVVPMLAGGAASTGVKGLAAVGLGAFEGASGGAQQAYEKNEALRDVVSSSLVGGLLGAGTAGLGEGLHGIINNRALKAAAKEMAEDANLGAVGVERSSLASLAGDEAGALDSKASDLAGAIKDYRFREGPLAGKSIIRALRTPEGLAPGVEQAAKETEQALATARKEAYAAAEKAGLASDLEGPILKNGDQYWGHQAPEEITDDIAKKAIEATGGDVAGFQALQGRAQAFKELASIIGKASESGAAKSALTDSLPAIAGVGKLLSGGSPLAAVAHSMLVTVGKKLVQQRSASTMAALANTMVLDTVSTALGHIMPAVTVSAAEAAGSAGAEALTPPKQPEQLNPEQKQDRYRKQLDDVNRAVNDPDHDKRMALLDKVGDFPAPFVIAAGADMSAKMAQLHADMPKPTPNIRGKAYETLSSQQVQLANAMYEATTNPMSVFSDFAAGNVDYDKVQYAWKQYPGLKNAAQAGLMDIMQVRLTEKTRGT
ncbi:MAG TPA: hypothetical protein VN639_07865, partial [Azonexus sp.]|nr:hypothetical protein [Azonexus sp.]